MNRSLVLAVIASLAGCAPMPASHTADGGTGTKGNYAIELKSAHAHIYKKVAQLFTVYDLDSCTNPAERATCKKVAKLPVAVFFRSAGETEVTEQQLSVGKLEDNGDGTYTYFSEIRTFGYHTIGLRFSDEHATYFSAFPFETTRGGGEKFFCDTNADSTPDLVHQVRWNASQGHLDADGKEVTFSLELMRSFNTPLNTAQPWSNSFDHLPPASLKVAPTVKLMADEGAASTEIATLTPTYKGKGIYEVKHAFTAAQLGSAAERNFWLDIRYTDSSDCVVKSVDAEEDYHFHVARAH